MKKILFVLLALASVISSFAQSQFTGIVLYVADSATYRASTTIVNAHANGKADLYWNAQATTPHFDWWDGAAYQHGFGSGSGGGSFNHLTPSVKTGDYTATAADTITHLYFRHVATPMTLTLPGSGTIPVGRYIVLTKDTTASVTVAGASGVDVIGTLTLTGDKETAVFHHRETNKWLRVGGSGGSVSDWGDIGGTLSDQTDLQTALDAKVNDTGNETIAGVKTFSSDPLIPDEAYDATNWNGILEPPTKNAVRDKIETLAPLASPTFTGTPTLPVGTITDDEAYDATGWNGDTAPASKNAVRDKIEVIVAATKVLVVAGSDEVSAIAAGTSKVTFRMPYAMTVTAVRISLNTAQATNGAGGIFTVDINESGTTILSTKLTIDNTEKTSTTAVTPAVISDSALADDAEITIDVDQVGDGTAVGVKIYLIGN